MNIILVFSEDWAKHVAVELYAIFKNNPPPVKVYLVSDFLSSQALDTYSKVQKHFGEGYRYVYLNVEQLYNTLIPSKVNVDKRFTKYTLYRLILPKVIEDDKVLYLDTDTIVNGDITDFYNLDLKGDLVAGVIDSGIYSPQYKYMLYNIGLTEKDPYINAGVTLFNWKEIRNLNLCDIWLREINSKLYGCHDQDVINMTCKGRLRVVDLAYNVSLSTGLNIKPEDIKIMHYAGSRETKPWTGSTKAPFYQIWNKWASEYKEVIK